MLNGLEIEALQMNDLSNPLGVLACAKHYLADGGTTFGTGTGGKNTLDQGNSQIDEETRAKVLDLKVGHVAVVGDQNVIPDQLIALLQREAILLPTENRRKGELAVLLARLYLAPARD